MMNISQRTSFSYEDEPLDLIDHFNVLGMVVTSVIFIMGSTGNALTLSTIIHQFCWLPLKTRSIDKFTAITVLIFNLALADFLYCFIALPPMYVTYYCHLSSNESSNETCPWLYANSSDTTTFCEVTAFFRYFIAYVEWRILAIMALERCIAVYFFNHRLNHSKIFTPIKTTIICICLWLFSLFELYFLLNDKYEYNEGAYKCDYVTACPSEPGDPSNIWSSSGYYHLIRSLLPNILILIGYLLILYKINFSGKRIMTSGTTLSRTSVMKRKSQKTTVYLRLLLSYTICVFPMSIFDTVQTVMCYKYPKRELGIILYCIYWVQYGINNITYVVSNRKYRFAFKQLLACISCAEMPVPKHKQFTLESVRSMQGRSHEPKPMTRTVTDHMRRLSINCTGYPSSDNDGITASSRVSTASMDSSEYIIPRYGIMESKNPITANPDGDITSVSPTDNLVFTVPRYGIPENVTCHRRNSFISTKF